MYITAFAGKSPVLILNFEKVFKSSFPFCKTCFGNSLISRMKRILFILEIIQQQ